MSMLAVLARPIVLAGVLALAVPGAIQAQGTAATDVAEKGVIHSIQVSQPRDFGYFPGDVVTREIYLSVDEDYSLQPASVPTAGALNYWLDLRNVDLKEDEAGGERRYLLTLKYQAFYVPLEVKLRELPSFTLEFVGPEGEDGERPMAQAHIPGFGFLMSPLREIQAPEPEGGPAAFLKSDRAPAPLKLRSRTFAFAGSAVAALLFLVLLAHHYAWGPFRHRPARPFTVGARKLRSQLRDGADAQTYRSGLLTLHRAFDQTAGQRVFAEDMPDFLESHSEFRAYAAEIGRFFESSRTAFFKDDADTARSIMPLTELAGLSARLAAAERRS